MFSSAAATNVRFFFRQTPAFDRYTNSRAFLLSGWLREHFDRMMEYSPYFDKKLAVTPPAYAYFDAYGISTRSFPRGFNPDWILRDEGGTERKYIPYDCHEGACPLYAADIGDPDYRRWWIAEAEKLVAKGYIGLWIDDVNLQFNVCDRDGQFSAPYDRRTKAAMTVEQWRRYMSDFMVEVREALPKAELLHNAIWFAGPKDTRDADECIVRQIEAADFINLERGVNDPGLQDGTGAWSTSALLAYIDRAHSRGTHVVIDDLSRNIEEREYALAAYLLISNGGDYIGNQNMTPGNWWRGYEVNLGRPLSERRLWQGLIRRDFDRGIVLMNAVSGARQTVILEKKFTSLNGNSTNSVSLPSRRGVILLNSGPSAGDTREDTVH